MFYLGKSQPAASGYLKSKKPSEIIQTAAGVSADTGFCLRFGHLRQYCRGFFRRCGVIGCDVVHEALLFAGGDAEVLQDGEVRAQLVATVTISRLTALKCSRLNK